MLLHATCVAKSLCRNLRQVVIFTTSIEIWHENITSCMSVYWILIHSCWCQIASTAILGGGPETNTFKTMTCKKNLGPQIFILKSWLLVSKVQASNRPWTISFTKNAPARPGKSPTLMMLVMKNIVTLDELTGSAFCHLFLSGNCFTLCWIRERLWFLKFKGWLFSLSFCGPFTTGSSWCWASFRRVGVDSWWRSAVFEAQDEGV